MMEEYVKELIKNEKRVDGRKLDEFRKIEVEVGLIEKAEGSAIVSFGNTKVMAGIKMNVGQPFEDTPKEGILIVNAEFSPIAHEKFEPGPPGEDAIELARIVDRIVREGKVLDLEKLSIVEGEKAWMVFIDIAILNHDGNLIDASTLASMLALMNARIPKYEDEKIIRGEYTGKLPVINKAVAVSIGKIDGKYLIDPSYVEEQVLDNKLVVGVREDKMICALQKQGRKEYEFKEVEKIIDLALEKSEELMRFLK